jgi:membrane-associated PAP2 superfamily phosphatase
MDKQPLGTSSLNLGLAINWLNWVLAPSLLGAGLLALFWWFNLDQQLAFYLSQQPGGFPFATSAHYEFIFHKIPKLLSGTLFIGMLLLAIGLLPWSAWIGKLIARTRSIYSLPPVLVKSRACRQCLPPGAAFSLWVSILAMVFAAEMIGHLKRAASVDCPINVQLFGGEKKVALVNIHEPFPHFGEGGRCWPGGHSITGFLFLACFFGFKRMGMHKAANISLITALAYGNFLGFTQVLRGQHYLSHQFWSAYLVWMFSLCFFIAIEKLSVMSIKTHLKK